MKYAVLIYGDEARWQSRNEAELEALHAGYMALPGDGIFCGAELQATESATTVRVRDGKTLTTDGPFADTKEVLGGLYMLEAGDLKTAVAFAEQIPDAVNGSIEIRPIVER